jgi:hypothetical protein
MCILDFHLHIRKIELTEWRAPLFEIAVSFIEEGSRLHTVVQLVETLRNKPEGCWLDSRWCHLNFLFHIVVVGPTQPLTEMSTRSISWGVKATGAWGWQPWHLHVLIVLKFWELQPPETLRACPGLEWDTFTLPYMANSGAQLKTKLQHSRTWSAGVYVPASGILYKCLNSIGVHFWVFVTWATDIW